MSFQEFEDWLCQFLALGMSFPLSEPRFLRFLYEVGIIFFLLYSAIGGLNKIMYVRECLANSKQMVNYCFRFAIWNPAKTISEPKKEPGLRFQNSQVYVRENWVDITQQDTA